MKYLLVLLSCTVAIVAQGFFHDEWTPRVAPTFDASVVKSVETGTATTTFSISVNDSVGAVLPTLWGNNSNFYLYKFSKDEKALNNLKATGAKHIRLPGGNTSNVWLWDGVKKWEFWGDYEATLASLPTKQWNIQTEEQALIADTIGAMPQPCVNVSLARHIKGLDSVQQAASYAADWVRQWNVVEKRGVKYWEVGNENYGSWQSGYIVNGDTITPEMYGEIFNVYADSMRAVDPTIKIGAVVFEGETNPWTGEWNQRLLPIIKDKADFLAVHQYFTFDGSDMNNITVTEVLDALVKIKETIEMLETQVATYAGKTAKELPVAMTEYNVRAGRKNSQQVSAVFNAMALGEYIRNDYGLVNIWDIANAFANGDDHGMFTRTDPQREDYSPNPTFYSYYLTNLYFGDKLVGVDSEEQNNIRIYPTKFNDGSLGIMVVNKGAVAQTVEMQLNGFKGTGKMMSHHLTANGPEEREVFLNGVSGGVVSGPLNYSDILPFETDYSGNPIVSVEPYSVNCYLLPYDSGNTGTLVTSQVSTSANTIKQAFTGNVQLNFKRKPLAVNAYSLSGRNIPVEWSWENNILKVSTDSPSLVILKVR